MKQIHIKYVLLAITLASLITPGYAQYTGGNGKGDQQLAFSDITLNGTLLADLTSYTGGSGKGDASASGTENGYLNDKLFTGSTSNNFTLGANWTGGTFPSNEVAYITSTATRQPVLSSSQTIAVGTTIAVGEGASLTVTSSGVLTVNGTLNVDTFGTFTLQSTTSANTAMVGNSSGTILGETTVERFMPSGRRAFRLLAHPFSQPIKLNQLMDDIHITGAGTSASDTVLGTTNGNGFDATFYNNPSAFTFNESAFNGTNNSGWSAFTNASANGNNILANQPIRILYRGPRTQGTNVFYNPTPDPLADTMEWTGKLNQGNVTVPLSFTSANGSNAGWNLVPNPYAANLQMDAIAAADRNNITSFAVWNPNMATRGAYQSVTFATSYVLSQGVGFFVKTGSSANFTFRESYKTTSLQIPAIFKTEKPVQTLVLDLVTDSSYFWDSWTLKNDNLYLPDQDIADAPKMRNPDINLYSKAGNQHTAIDFRPIKHNDIIDLWLENSASFNFGFKVNTQTIIPYDVYLIDAFTNTQTMLVQGGQYNFATTADSASKAVNRFKLVFKNATTGGNDALNNISQHITAYPNPATEELYVSFSKSLNTDGLTYRLFNLAGKEELQGKTDHKQGLHIPIEQLIPGIYILQLQANDFTHQLKFIKQ